MRDPATGICSECESPPEAYHRRDCTQFKGYHCWNHDRTYYGDRCPECPPIDATYSDVCYPVDLPRRHVLEPRRWRISPIEIVGEALNQDAIDLLKRDPDEYFRRTRPT